MTNAAAHSLSRSIEPIITMELLKVLGFHSASTAGGPGLEILLGPWKLSALECMRPGLQNIVFLSGTYATSRTLRIVSYPLPVTFETREVGLAFLADSLRSYHLREWEPAWLAEGRGYAHLLPSERERAEYDARPKCVVSHEWLRLALRTLTEGSAGMDATTPISFAFDGTLLTIRCEQLVVAVPASGARWEAVYELRPQARFAPPPRFMQQQIEVSVFTDNLTIGRHRYREAGVLLAGAEMGSMHE